MIKKEFRLLIFLFLIAVLIMLVISILLKLNPRKNSVLQKEEVIIDKCVQLAAIFNRSVSYCVENPDKEVLLISPEDYINNPLRSDQRFVIIANMDKFITDDNDFCVAIREYNNLSDFYLKQEYLYKTYSDGQTIYICSDKKQEAKIFSFTGVPKKGINNFVLSLNFYSLIFPQPLKVSDLVSYFTEIHPIVHFALPVVSN